MKFEDEQSTFYESAMNAEAKRTQSSQYKTDLPNNNTAIPPVSSYNPFDEFSINEF